MRLDFLENPELADAFEGSLSPEDIITNIELLTGVEQHNLRPLTFHEFLWASEETALIKAFESQANSAAAHTKLFDKLTDYYFTGGMPEAAATWFDSAHASILG